MERINITLPTDLYTWVSRRAKRNERTMAAEVRYLLQQQRRVEERTATEPQRVDPLG